MFGHIRCITFDLDDTLWECMPVIKRAEALFYTWLQEHYPRIPEQLGYDELIQHRIGYMRQYPQLMHDLTVLRKQWMGELISLGDYDDKMIEPGFRIFWEARNDVTLFDHVEDTLGALGQHFRIGAITNGNADVEFIGIGHLFDFSVSSAEAGNAKPHADIFHLAAEKAGIPLEETLHVGDDLERDVVGALDAGAMAAWITAEKPNAHAAIQPHITVPHIRELLPHLARSDR